MNEAEGYILVNEESSVFMSQIKLLSPNGTMVFLSSVHFEPPRMAYTDGMGFSFQS